MAAATILEQHGDPPIVLDLASQDKLDHVLLAVPARRTLGIGRQVARSRPRRQEARVPHDPRSRLELRRSLCRRHRSCRGIRSVPPRRADARRLAARERQRLAGRARRCSPRATSRWWRPTGGTSARCAATCRTARASRTGSRPTTAAGSAGCRATSRAGPVSGSPRWCAGSGPPVALQANDRPRDPPPVPRLLRIARARARGLVPARAAGRPHAPVRERRNGPIQGRVHRRAHGAVQAGGDGAEVPAGLAASTTTSRTSATRPGTTRSSRCSGTSRSATTSSGTRSRSRGSS